MTNEAETSGTRDKNDKKNWFHSLSRRRKSSTSTTNSASHKSQGNDSTDSPRAATSTLASNQAASLEVAPESNSQIVGKDRKRKDDRKNVFQRFKKRIGVHFSMRRKKNSQETFSSNSNGVDLNPKNPASSNESAASAAANYVEPPEMIPFTHHYRRFVTKKWLENGSRPNRVMYTACSEMLSQVWYWGEISRHDAQRQLKDKPVGSFLVRDSETGGSSTSWYTLSFRILNSTLHYRLEYQSNYWKFEELQYESIVEMIEDILHRCTKDHFVCYVRVPNEMQPPLPVVLKHPISRYNNIMNLQDLCRRVIQRHVKEEDIQELQIPVKLQEYLAEKRGLVFQSA